MSELPRGGQRALSRLLTRLRAKAEESGSALVDRVAWGKCHATGRPYPPIGSIDFGSKWIVSRLRPTWWSIDIAIVGWASDPAHSHLEISKRHSDVSSYQQDDHASSERVHAASSTGSAPTAASSINLCSAKS